MLCLLQRAYPTKADACPENVVLHSKNIGSTLLTGNGFAASASEIHNIVVDLCAKHRAKLVTIATRYHETRTIGVPL